MSKSPIVVFETFLSPQQKEGDPSEQNGGIYFVAPANQLSSESLAIRQWLALRNSVFSSAARSWTVKEFHREFVSKKWWSFDRLLFSFNQAKHVVGAVVLGEYSSGQSTGCCGSIQWLMTANGLRRRGIASGLVKHLETIAFRDFNYSRIRLETLREWTDAISFYEARGYQQLTKK